MDKPVPENDGMCEVNEIKFNAYIRLELVMLFLMNIDRIACFRVVKT
jgi:hypothetical protein